MSHLGTTLGDLFAFMRSHALVHRSTLTDDFAGFGLSEKQVDRVLEVTTKWVWKIAEGNLDLWEDRPGQADEFFGSLVETPLTEL